MSQILKTSDKLPCRDPFIMLYEGKYHLYRRSLTGNSIECLISDDLEHWQSPVTVYAPAAGFHGVKDLFWAPECHFYKGKFYIFTSVFSGEYNHRMISVYRADAPLGPFEDIAGGHISPEDWDAIDGTLYIDKDDAPWMVFVHEWTCMPDKVGTMVAARLSDDLSHFISKPITLFSAKDPEWAVSGVTDGPFLHRSKAGLCMIWSNFSKSGYVVAMAYSDNGRLDGKWLQADRLLYEKDMRPEFVTDGGHGMLFYDKDGALRLSLHGPNSAKSGSYEHLQIYSLREVGDLLEIV